MAYVDKWLADIASIKRQEAELEKERRALEAKVMEFLEKNGVGSVDWDANGVTGRATIVRSSQLIYDHDLLSKAVGPAIWRAITKRVIDTKSLEDKVARGIVPIEVVAEHTTEKPRKPYLHITSK